MSSLTLSKKEIYKKYNKLNHDYIKRIINEIISNCRKISLEKAKPISIITPKEFRQFVEEVGEI